MTISAVSLRDSNSYKVNKNNVQSFGKRNRANNSDDGMKSRKAAGIAIAVGMTAAIAVAAYVFRHRIADIPFVKKGLQKGKDVAAFVKAQGEAIAEKGQDLGKKTKSVFDYVGTKTKEFCEKTKDLGKNAKGIAEEVGQKASKLKDDTVEMFEKVKKNTSELVGKKTKKQKPKVK